MRKRTINAEKFAEIVAKMQEEKRMINEHIAKGKNLSELEAKGIRFVKPI